MAKKRDKENVSSMRERNQKLIVSIFEAKNHTEKQKCLSAVRTLERLRRPMKKEFLTFIAAVAELHELATSITNFPKIKAIGTKLKLPEFNPDDDYGIIDEICLISVNHSKSDDFDAGFSDMLSLVENNTPDPNAKSEFATLYRHVGKALNGIAKVKEEADKMSVLRRLRRLQVPDVPQLH